MENEVSETGSTPQPIYRGREASVGRVSTHVDGEPKTLTALHEDIQAAANAEADRANYASPSLISDTQTEMSGGEMLLAMQIMENRVRYLEAVVKRLLESQHRDLM